MYTVCYFYAEDVDPICITIKLNNLVHTLHIGSIFPHVTTLSLTLILNKYVFISSENLHYHYINSSIQTDCFPVNKVLGKPFWVAIARMP